MKDGRGEVVKRTSSSDEWSKWN